MPSRLRLDETGSEVWRLLDGGRTLATIIESVEKVKGNESDDLPQRVELFVRTLVNQGFAGVDELR
jgi:hypothetical protein